MKINYWEIIKNSWVFLKLMWPFFAFVVAILAIRILMNLIDLEIVDWRIRRKFKKGEEWRSDRDLLKWLRGMKPSEFEKYISDLFSRLGYKSRAVGRSHDGGVDVIAEKDGVKHYIQCKKFITSRVTVHDIRDFYGALADRLANGKGYFITTNKFTLEAEKFAEDKPIELIDGQKLIKYIHLTKNETERCPLCGGYLVRRKGKYGEFYGCSNYPKCHYTKKIEKL